MDVAPLRAEPTGGAYLRGAAWAALSGGASILLPLLVFLAFAREIGPESIGRFALAVSIAEILKACGMPGIYEALLNRPQRPARSQAAALALFLAVGVLLVPVHGGLLVSLFALTGSAPPMADLLLLLVIGLRIPIDLALLQPQAELARRGAYARLAARGLIGNLGATTLGLGILAAGHPMLGLTAYTLGISVGNALATVFGTRALRRPRWDGARLRALWPEGRAASAVRFCATANNQLDQLLVGVIAGPLVFAQFNFAKRIEAAFGSLSSILATSLFQPDFVSRTTPAARAEGLRNALTIVAVTCGSVAAAFVASADLVVDLLLGSAWAAAAPAAAVLAASGYGRAIGGVHAALLSVSGRNGTLFARFALTILVGAALVATTAHLGAKAAALAVAAQIVVGVVLLAAATKRSTGVSALRLHLAYAVAPFLVMIAVAAASRWAVMGLNWNADIASPELSLTAVLAASLGAGATGLAFGIVWLGRIRRPTRVVAAKAELVVLPPGGGWRA